MASVLTNVGRGIITGRLRGLGTEPKNIGWGTGAGTAAVTDTTLFTESSEARVIGTSSQQTTTTTNDTYQVVATVSASASRAITNAGLFDDAGGLFVKGDHPTVNLAQDDSIQYTAKLQFLP